MATYYRINLRDKQGNICYPNIDPNITIDKDGNVTIKKDIIINNNLAIDNQLIMNTNSSIVGGATFVNLNDYKLRLNRWSAEDDEFVEHFISDKYYDISYTNDETNCNIRFSLINLDAEESDGSKANSSQVIFTGNSAGSTITADYMSLTKHLSIGGDQYYTNDNYGIHMHNSDIVGLNSVWFADYADDCHEGLHFVRSDGNYNTLWGRDGVLFWTSSHAKGVAPSTSYTVVTTAGATMVGNLVLANDASSQIRNASGYHLVSYNSSTTGTSLASAGDKTEIRSSGNNLTHYRKDTEKNYIILDAANYSSYALPLSGGTVSGNITANKIFGSCRGKTYSITVTGSSSTFYPVVIKMSTNKDVVTHISIWKDLGSTTPSVSGNHSNGTSSMWLMYEGRNTMWDGNGGYMHNTYYSMPYANLCASANALGNANGNLVVYLRGGTCQYNITTTEGSAPSVYYSSTNLGSSDYPVNVAPITSVGNGGRFATTFTSPVFNGVLVNNGNYYVNIKAQSLSASRTAYLPLITTYLTGSENHSVRNFYATSISTWNSNYSSYAVGTVGFCW